MVKHDDRGFGSSQTNFGSLELGHVAVGASLSLYIKNNVQRDYIEGWPLLTVETEVNGDSKSTNERGPSLGWFVGFVLPWLLY
jgi:hypothetical protein